MMTIRRSQLALFAAAFAAALLLPACARSSREQSAEEVSRESGDSGPPDRGPVAVDGEPLAPATDIQEEPAPGDGAPEAGRTAAAGPDRFTDLVLEDYHGRRIRFADFGGKVRVFDLWATWCGPCRMGIPVLNAIFDRYRGRGLIVVGIAVDSSPADIAEFQKEIPLHYPSAIATAAAEELFGPTDSVPTTFIVDRSGRVVKRFVGYVDPRILEREIRGLL